MSSTTEINNVHAHRKSFLSPTNGRACTPAVFSPDRFTTQNDYDVSEARNHRRSLVFGHNLTSPYTPTDRRNSNVLQRLTSAQQHEHHSDCIKLSTENKINSKNAFSLHLIDVMSSLLQRKQLENFQVASSTLDASAKIYAGRVDSVHTDAYKLMAGLGNRANSNAADADVEDINADEDNTHIRKTKKTKKKKAIIVTNLKKINKPSSNSDDEDVDPLLHDTLSVDISVPSGLLAYRLPYHPSTGLIFDSDAPYVTSIDKSELPTRRPLTTEQTSSLSSLFEALMTSFANYQFPEWTITPDENSNKQQPQEVDNIHCFDAAAPAGDASPEEESDVAPDDVPHNTDIFEMTQLKSALDSDAFTPSQLTTSTQNTTVHLESGTSTVVNHVLGNIFGKHFLRSWAGPQHWSYKNNATNFHISNAVETKKSRPRKPRFVLEYTDDVEYSQYQAKKRRTKSKATLSKDITDTKLLPKNLNYKCENLVVLFDLPLLKVVQRRGSMSQASEDINIADYNYGNANDVANFCPDADVDDTQIDGDMDLFSGSSEEVTFGLSHDVTELNTMMEQLSVGDNSATALTDDNLVPEPKKVTNIFINYARTARRIDVKRLKSAMWNILVDSETTPSVSETPADTHSRKMSAQHTFQEMLSVLPAKLSKQSADNLSVSVAFVCLLHLANEKTLVISGSETTSDLVIRQEA